MSITETPFRVRTESPVSPEIEAPAVETKNVVSEDTGKEIGDNFEEKSNDLEDWEVSNGKYGLEYLSIKEIAKEFPVKMQFPFVDSYIKEEMKTRGLDSTRENWQKILSELETESNTDKKDSFKRIAKLYEFIKTLRKFKALKDKKESFKFS